MKKLIPAICLLLVSAVMLGTSTFAWFSMNTSVSVTGMQVKAKSDNTYLLISDTVSGETAAAKAASIQEADSITVEFSDMDENTQLYPCAPCLTAAEAAYLPATTGKQVGETAIVTAGAQVNNAATAAAVTNWYTATAEASDDEAMKTGSARQLTTFTNYVIHKTLYLTVAEGANPANNLTVTATFTQYGAGNDVDAVKIVITTDDGGFAVLTTSNYSAVDISGSNTDISDVTIRQVDIYIYVDGNDDAIYTNNAANLTGATISLAFDVDSHV